MRVLLIYPPYSLHEIYDKLEAIGNTSPPLGIGYIAAVLEKAGHVVKVIDAPTLSYKLKDILRELEDFRPEAVGLTCLTPDFSKSIALAEAIKKISQRPIIIGGPHVTAAPAETIRHDCFDFGVIGEGEDTIVELINFLEHRAPTSLFEIRGLIFREGERIIRTPPRPFISDLDKIPFPARHLMPTFDQYHPTPASYKHLPLGTLVTSRGCPFHCVYCDRAIFGNMYRFRSAKNVVDEIELLVKKYGARELRLWDDTFNAQISRVIEICQEIVRRGIKVTWTCLGRVNFVTDDLIKWMKRAGCWQISFGIESGDDEVLKKIKKGQTKEMVRKAFKICQRQKMGTRGFFIIGLPGDTEETMQATIDFAKELPLDVAGFYVTIPFPGTELTDTAKKTGELLMSEHDQCMYDQFLVNLPDKLFYVPNGLSETVIRKYQKRAYHEFYMRPRYILKQFLQIQSLKELLNKIKAFFVIREI
ncbi:MAG: radical SAM protein [Patescibacteria group bacterium]